MGQGLLLSPASLSRMRDAICPWPQGRPLSAPAPAGTWRGLQEGDLGSWLPLLLGPAVFVLMPSFCSKSQLCFCGAPGPPVLVPVCSFVCSSACSESVPHTMPARGTALTTDLGPLIRRGSCWPILLCPGLYQVTTFRSSSVCGQLRWLSCVSRPGARQLSLQLGVTGVWWMALPVQPPLCPGRCLVVIRVGAWWALYLLLYFVLLFIPAGEAGLDCLS